VPPSLEPQYKAKHLGPVFKKLGSNDSQQCKCKCLNTFLILVYFGSSLQHCAKTGIFLICHTVGYSSLRTHKKSTSKSFTKCFAPAISMFSQRKFWSLYDRSVGGGLSIFAIGLKRHCFFEEALFSRWFTHSRV